MSRSAGETSGTTLRRGIRILFALGSVEAVAAGGLGVLRVAELLELDKSQASRTLRTLEETGAVDRDPDTLLYRLGWRFAALAGVAGDQRLLDLARPVVAALVGRLEESAHLSVLQGTDVLTVLSESSTRLLQAMETVGRRSPAACTSAGRALLLDRTGEELAALFGDQELPRCTPTSATDLAELTERIVRDRDVPAVVAEDELELGLVAVAAPVRAGGHIVAAVNVSGPTARLRPQLAELCRAVADAAAELSVALDDDGRPARSRGTA